MISQLGAAATVCPYLLPAHLLSHSSSQCSRFAPLHQVAIRCELYSQQFSSRFTRSDRSSSSSRRLPTLPSPSARPLLLETSIYVSAPLTWLANLQVLRQFEGAYSLLIITIRYHSVTSPAFSVSSIVCLCLNFYRSAATAAAPFKLRQRQFIVSPSGLLDKIWKTQSVNG